MTMKKIIETLMKLAKATNKSQSQLIYKNDDVYLVVIRCVGTITNGELQSTVEIEQ